MKDTLEAISVKRSGGIVGIDTVGFALLFSANILRQALSFWRTEGESPSRLWTHYYIEFK
jgi:hypothetical protein